MKPDRSDERYAMNMFNMPLEKFIDKNHELVLLADRIDWSRIDDLFEEYYSDKGRKGMSTRLLVGLQILKYMKNLSDETVCAMWVENPYFQYFCGEKLFQYELPIDRSSISKWRKRVDVEKLEKILQESLYTAYDTGALNAQDVQKVIVDTTVQEKAVDYPTEAKLLTDAILDLGRSAKRAGLKLKQNYRFIAKELAVKCSRYAHARQMNRLKKTIKKMKLCLFKLGERVANAHEKIGLDFVELAEHLKERLIRARHVLMQKKGDKEQLLVWHAPEVECIAKGKARSMYEFGCKVSLAINVNPSNGGILS